MPNTKGREVYVELKKIRPDLETLLMNGYTAGIASDRGVPEQDLLFLPKPFAPPVLLKKVRTILGKRT